jgi:hypothetical protein
MPWSDEDDFHKFRQREEEMHLLCSGIDNGKATRGMSAWHTFLSWEDRREMRRTRVVYASAFGLPVEKAVD